MPRLPSIFEDKNFIKELYGILHKTAQAQDAIDPTVAQLALSMLDRLSSTSPEQIAPGSRVSLVGGMTPDKQPGVSDLYSLSAFIRYLGAAGAPTGGTPEYPAEPAMTGQLGAAPEHNFQYNGMPIVVSGEIQSPGYVLYKEPGTGFTYSINKEGLIDILKTMANNAATTNNLYLKELVQHLIDDAVAMKSFDIKADTFTEHTQKLDPTAASAAPATPAPAAAPAAPKATPGAVPVSDKTVTPGKDTGDAALAGFGIPSLYNWFPFWGNGRVNFTDIDYFITIFNKSVQEHAAQMGLDFRLAAGLAPLEQEIRNLETVFNAATARAPILQSERGIQYSINEGAIQAVKDFKEQFGLDTTPGGGHTLADEIRVARVMQRAVQVTRYVLQMLQTPDLLAAFSRVVPEFNEMVQIQLDEANRLERDLGQAAELISRQQQAIRPGQ